MKRNFFIIFNPTSLSLGLYPLESNDKALYAWMHNIILLYCLFFKWPSRIISLFQMSLSVFRSFLFKWLRQMQNLLLVSLPFYSQTTIIKPLIFFYVLLFFLFSRFPNHTFVKTTLNTCFLSLPSFIHPANYQVFMLKYRYHNFVGKRIETEHILHRYIYSNFSLRKWLNKSCKQDS